MPLLETLNLVKRFRDEEGRSQEVVDVPSFVVEEGEQAAIKGPSGCGKTTFLHLVSGILAADEGSIQVAGTELTSLSEARRDRFRAENIGYVFQSFHLMRDYTCLENVQLGMSFGPGVDKNFARKLLEEVGLGHRLNYKAMALSVGQQQRVALARALANRPKLVLADEPTGSLDEENAGVALSMIRKLCQENGAALILASHDRAIVETFDTKVDFAALNQASATNAGGLAK